MAASRRVVVLASLAASVLASPLFHGEDDPVGSSFERRKPCRLEPGHVDVLQAMFEYLKTEADGYASAGLMRRSGSPGFRKELQTALKEISKDQGQAAINLLKGARGKGKQITVAESLKTDLLKGMPPECKKLWGVYSAFKEESPDDAPVPGETDFWPYLLSTLTLPDEQLLLDLYALLFTELRALATAAQVAADQAKKHGQIPETLQFAGVGRMLGPNLLAAADDARMRSGLPSATKDPAGFAKEYGARNDALNAVAQGLVQLPPQAPLLRTGTSPACRMPASDQGAFADKVGRVLEALHKRGGGGGGGDEEADPIGPALLGELAAASGARVEVARKGLRGKLFGGKRKVTAATAATASAAASREFDEVTKILSGSRWPADAEALSGQSASQLVHGLGVLFAALPADCRLPSHLPYLGVVGVGGAEGAAIGPPATPLEQLRGAWPPEQAALPAAHVRLLEGLVAPALRRVTDGAARAAYLAMVAPLFVSRKILGVALQRRIATDGPLVALLAALVDEIMKLDGAVGGGAGGDGGDDGGYRDEADVAASRGSDGPPPPPPPHAAVAAAAQEKPAIAKPEGPPPHDGVVHGPVKSMTPADAEVEEELFDEDGNLLDDPSDSEPGTSATSGADLDVPPTALGVGVPGETSSPSVTAATAVTTPVTVTEPEGTRATGPEVPMGSEIEEELVDDGGFLEDFPTDPVDPEDATTEEGGDDDRLGAVDEAEDDAGLAAEDEVREPLPPSRFQRKRRYTHKPGRARSGGGGGGALVAVREGQPPSKPSRFARRRAYHGKRPGRRGGGGETGGVNGGEDGGENGGEDGSEDGGENGGENGGFDGLERVEPR